MEFSKIICLKVISEGEKKKKENNKLWSRLVSNLEHQECAWSKYVTKKTITNPDDNYSAIYLLTLPDTFKSE